MLDFRTLLVCIPPKIVSTKILTLVLEKQQTYKLFERILKEYWVDTQTLPYLISPPPPAYGPG